MSTPIVNVMSGHYNAYYNGLFLGATEEGWEIDIVHKGTVVSVEEAGETEVDMIGRGAQVRVRGIVKEWDAPGLMSALWGANVIANGSVTTFGSMPCVGQSSVRAVDAQGNTRAKPLVLVKSSCYYNVGSVQGEGFNHGWNGNIGTPSWSTTGPSDVAMNTITFHRAILTPDSVSKINLNNKPRVVPVEFMIFLVTDPALATNYRFFTVSA